MEPAFWQGMLFAFWLLYVVGKDAVVPLVNKLRGKATESKGPAGRDLCPVEGRVTVLELDLGSHKVRLADLAELIKEHGEETERTSISLDNKLDLVLTELKEAHEAIEARLAAFGERLKGVEVHIEHILKGGSRRSGD